MRIISGQFGGRSITSPHGNRTHPMSEKARGGIFNALGDVSGLTVLDAFAGSGALGFEALSRGAKSVVAIDNDKNAQKAMTESAEALGLGQQFKLISAPVSSWLDTTNASFDLILIDPPYDKPESPAVNNLFDRCHPDGIVVLSLPPSTVFTPPTNFTQVATKKYGDCQIYFYKR